MRTRAILFLSPLLATACPTSRRDTIAPPAAPAPIASTPIAEDDRPSDPLASVSLAARPDWMDRFADHAPPGDLRFFNISALMRELGIDRARAVELQNHYRDAGRRDPGQAIVDRYDAARARAIAGEFEDHRDIAKLAAAPFVVVFDLDETLYDQSYPSQVAATCRDLEVEDGGERRAIKLAPGAAAALDRVSALGGAVVLFSAAPDDATLLNLRAWQFGGKPLPDHPAIAGVLTNSHLVLQSTLEGSGSEIRRRGRPVIEPSKDLRIFDESLARVILVDDNPTRTFQFRNVRLVQKFDAERYCSTKDAKLRQMFESTLPKVVDDIENSARYMRVARTDFATAFLPYTILGRVAVDGLRRTGMSERAAIEHVRKNPGVVDDDF